MKILKKINVIEKCQYPDKEQGIDHHWNKNQEKSEAWSQNATEVDMLMQN